MLCLLKPGLLPYRQIYLHYETVRTICVSQILYITYKRGYGSKWRVRDGQAENKSKYGPLTDLPDYTFLDGRPTPLTKGQIRRRDENIQMAKRIMGLLQEVDFAKENHQRRTKDEKTKRKEILENKLKPKV